MKKACFCGTFDPVTQGHLDLIQRATRLFDEVVVVIGVNSDKHTMCPLDQRKQWLEEALKDLPHVRVQAHAGLATEICKEIKADIMIRGVRNGVDLEYEKNMAAMNHLLDPSIETVILLASEDKMHCSSSNVREFLRYGKDVSQMVPACVARDLKEGDPK